MNSRQLQYAIELSKLCNFSQVAKKLNISQPALSKQILSLENELGIKLFDRNSIPMTVTPAGQHFIQEAQELLYREDQLLRSIERFKSGEAGQLTIGVTPFRSAYLIPEMVKEFHKVYPNIQVKLHEVGSNILRKDATEGKYDFAVVNLPVDDSVLEVFPLEKDKLVLAVPTNLMHLLPETADCGEIDLKGCKELPFVMVGQTQEMRRLFNKLCAAANFHPNIVAEVVSLTTAWSMTCAGVGATILPHQFVKRNPAKDRITVISISSDSNIRQPAIITKKGQYISEPARYAMELLIKNSH